MKKWICGIIYGVLLAFLAAIVGYEVLVTKNYDTGLFLKAGLCAIALITSMVKTFFRPARRPSNRRALYRKAYAEFIEGAFNDDKKLEKKFMDALEAYNRERYAASLDLLNKLLPQCMRTTDRYAVTVFQALCCHDMNLYREAIGYYEAAMLIRPNTTLASNQGMCYEKLGDYEAAEKAYCRATQLDPQNASALNNMAQMCLRTGDYEDALKYATLAYERNQKLVPALNALAISNYMLGDQEAYRRWYRQAVACGSDAAKLKAYIASLDATL